MRMRTGHPRHIRAAIATGLVLVVVGAGVATALDDWRTYDLLFRDGTLDPVPRDEALLYRRDVTNGIRPDAADRDTGRISLSIVEGDGMELAHLEFRQDGSHDGRHRRLGRFPASVGNPMIMYFYEVTARDMAVAAGGSPFYIRNRIKDAMARSHDVEAGTADHYGRLVTTRTVRMRPFADDPNRDRMGAFADLELTVIMSEDVPGWYLGFVAEAAPAYRSEVTLEGLGRMLE